MKQYRACIQIVSRQLNKTDTNLYHGLRMRLSHLVMNRGILGFRCWRRKIAGRHRAVEGLALVCAITERNVRGMATTAKCDDGSACKAEGFAFLIHDFEITFYTDGTIIEDGYFCSGHGSLPKVFWKCGRCVSKITRDKRDYKDSRHDL